MKISTKSIWDQLACFPDQYIPERTNICTYTRAVLRGIFASILFVIIGVVLGYILLFPFAMGLMTLVTGHYLHNDFIFGSLVMYGIFGYTIALVQYKEWKTNRPSTYKYSKPKEPSFISLRWKAFKEKTCFMIERER